MQLATVSCNKCGAALQVPETARFVTCRYCGAQLEVKRTESTISTEVLDRIDQRTADMAEDLDAIRRATEVEQLDREWALKRDALLVRNKNGSTSRPSVTGGLIVIFVGGGFCLFWTIMAFAITAGASHAGAPGAIMLFPFFGIAGIAGAVFGGIKMMTASQDFDAAERQYQQRRQEILARSHDQPTTPV
ncbi:MAG: hypothetical protein ACTHN5_20215 [Phycisphaerae bacterium]